jgi:hypothetical protein
MGHMEFWRVFALKLKKKMLFRYLDEKRLG